MHIPCTNIVINRDHVLGALVGAAAAQAGATNQEMKQHKKAAAAARKEEERLARADRIQSMVIPDENPIVKWFARGVYMVGAVGLAVVGIHIFW